jgi:hypothetical protein
MCDFMRRELERVDGSPQSRGSGRFSLKHYLAGAICLVSVALMLEQSDVRLPAGVMAIAGQLSPPERCTKVVQGQATLSRDSLAKLLTVSEGTSRTQIQAIVKQPYCKLPNVTVRVGETTQREAYPLAFKPDTWLVVIYEGDRYAGFDFLVR